VLAICLLLFAQLDAEKMIVVRVEPRQTQGTLQRFEKRGEKWDSIGPALHAVVGRNGVASGDSKKEGDLKTPAGTFRFVGATGYAKDAPAGTSLPYVRATRTLKCVDDPRSKYYNRVLDERTVRKDWTRAEEMLLPDDRYRRVLILDYNSDPTVPGKGSCIFIHVWRKKNAPTAGCVALPLAGVEMLMRWADAKTTVVITEQPK
jgi:D-alanyl-D-alanine dipeptidase